MKNVLLVLLNFLFVPFGHGQIENIVTDSQTFYFNSVVNASGGYVLGGAKSSCKIAKVWFVDSVNQGIVSEKTLLWPGNSYGEVVDINRTDTGFLVLTEQRLADDVGGPQLVLYSLDEDLVAVDSFNYGERSFYIKEFYLLGSSILYKTADTLYHRIMEHNALFSTPVDASNQDLVPLLYEIYTFQDSLIVSYKTNLESDTIVMEQPILDLTSTGCFEQEVDSAGILFALTDSSILRFLDSTWKEFPISQSLERIHWDPFRNQVAGIDSLNNFYLYDIDSFYLTDSVSLFYRPYYNEKLNWRPFINGIWGRTGTTSVSFETLDSEKYRSTRSQEFGFYQFFNPDHQEEISLDRPDLSLDSVWLIDSFYLGESQVMNGDTLYKDNNELGKVGLLVSNNGPDTIFIWSSGTNQLGGSNCSKAYVYISDSIELSYVAASYDTNFAVFSDPYISSVDQTRDLVIYSGFPNKRYDVAFENNIRLLTHGYIMTGANNQPLIKSSDLKVFPNPSTGDITIEWNGDKPIKNIEIINSSGKIVSQIPLEAPIRLTSIKPNVNPGLYFIKIDISEGYIIKKVLFTH